MSVPGMPEEVETVFDGYPSGVRKRLEQTRALIFDLADDLRVGPLTETLKWGEPAYLTGETKAGSTVRLGLNKGRPAVFFICHTGLVDGFRADYPEALSYIGNRGLLLDDGTEESALAICLTRALTYHRDKRRRA